MKESVIILDSIYIFYRLPNTAWTSEPGDRGLHVGREAGGQHIKMLIWPLARHRRDSSRGVIKMYNEATNAEEQKMPELRTRQHHI